jgi:hypothetical protein
LITFGKRKRERGLAAGSGAKDYDQQRIRRTTQRRLQCIAFQ